MSGRFFRRTVRNVVFRNHPYFAHLAFTHRCNLRCRFCHIQETKFAELDTAGTKRAIDVLDRLGVAVLSVSGGGEPLLREDFAGIPATIRYLNDHLPPGMQSTKVWLNPVVVGSGKLRTTTLAKVGPGHLEHGDLPTLLSARFYSPGV